jgi:hypothetical protein
MSTTNIESLKSEITQIVKENIETILSVSLDMFATNTGWRKMNSLVFFAIFSLFHSLYTLKHSSTAGFVKLDEKFPSFTLVPPYHFCGNPFVRQFSAGALKALEKLFAKKSVAFGVAYCRLT